MGFTVGTIVGFEVGVFVGTTVGLVVGSPVVATVGCIRGEPLGITVGTGESSIEIISTEEFCVDCKDGNDDGIDVE